MKRGEQRWVLQSGDDEMRKGDGFILFVRWRSCVSGCVFGSDGEE